MKLKHLEKLSSNYLELLNDDEDFNVIINVGDSPYIKSFQAHSAILRYRSLYFHDKLANVIKDNNDTKTINLKNILTEHFEVILKYIYGGVCLLEDFETSFIFELTFVAHEFLLDELAKNLETYLIESKPSWLRLHFSCVYQKSFQNAKLHVFQK
ncbi:hypothetical protein C2G38_445831 [Gigaspora rosea]|uniref:BTB domain-containing protein n=1 Tax=Gigaspora rosea TaxID=44941 RepID=A0A397UAB4_9GLOM|nr:hypothetical protein C2G38_445831 [Gigaspora rosea]